MKKLNSKGSLHLTIPLLVIVTVGLVGSYLLIKGHAQAPTADSNSTNTTTATTTSSTVALWHMDETSGTTAYDSARTHNGTIFNVQLGLAGYLNKSYGFNGSSSYVSVPSASDLNPDSSKITVAIHVKTTGTPPTSPKDWDLIRKGDYAKGGSEYKMELQSTGQASCGFEGSNGYAELAAGPAINNGSWHTVKCVKSSTNIQVIVDGAVFSKSANVGSISNTSPVIIGSHPAADWYNGNLDEARITLN